ncbi:hypothetical protein GYMLUDRAFT_217139 [Collybiopsis luxurians FD-317 M1]|nr:hypothetical protein GYMLUDRAFT_217139 [Collybiopsis luxurians FD-317 M1]
MRPRPSESRGSLGGLQRHGSSAKQLIQLYEGKALNTQSTNLSTPPSCSLKKPPSVHHKKDSPIRQSLSKVLGLFKKGSFRQIYDIPTLHSTPSGSRLSGPLLWLSVDEQSDLLAWKSCTAALECGTIRISYSTPQNDFNSLSIQLQHCSDVRSLSMYEIPQEELACLPFTRHGEEHRVFELEFGGAIERFAASSIKDRASWVSSVWDSILLMQESKNACKVGDTTSHSKPSPRLIEERSLPALPPPDNHNLCFELDPRSEYPVVQPKQLVSTIVAVPANSSPSQSLRSASIAHLSKRSMVKQRLAQMERDHSEVSITSSPHPPGRSKPLPSPHPPLSTIKDQSRKSRDPTWTMQDAEENTSIIDSYSYSDQTVDTCKAAVAAMPIWSQLTVSPIAEDPQSEAELCALRETTLHVEAQAETSYRPSGLELDLAMNSQPYHDTADLIATQVVQNSKQMVALNEVHGSISKVDREVHDTRQVVLTIDEKLDSLRNCIDSSMRDAANQSSSSGQDMRLEEASIRLPLEPKPDQLPSPCASSSETPAQLTDILALIREQDEKNNQRDLLQTDSVRYLNELNTWLETFVNGGTSQIHTLSNSLHQVLQLLGTVSYPDSAQSPGLLQDVQRLVQEGQIQNQNAAALHAAVNNLVTHLNVQSGTSGQPISAQGIAELIERHRQDHESLMRMLTNELSNEIKGERLRFVDAMKEATAINVQAHVEEFKKELKREVQGMTKEVGRLHRERQAIENQITDLFAFYSKLANNGTISPESVPAFERVFAQSNRGGRGLRTPQPSPERRRGPESFT